MQIFVKIWDNDSIAEEGELGLVEDVGDGQIVRITVYMFSSVVAIFVLLLIVDEVIEEWPGGNFE